MRAASSRRLILRYTLPSKRRGKGGVAMQLMTARIEKPETGNFMRVAPAMGAGVSDRVWGFREIVRLDCLARLLLPHLKI